MNIKHPLWLAGLALVSSGVVQAQEMAKVISSTPIIRQVQVSKQVCSVQPVVVQPQKSGAGALMGAIAGGAIGNAVTDGRGQAAATMLGLVGGAIMGDRIEGAPAAQVQNVQQCQWQTVSEPQISGYRVVYEYAGKQYITEMSQEPGAHLPLSVTPVVPSSAIQPTNLSHPVLAQAPVVVAAPASAIRPVVVWNLSYGWPDRRDRWYHR